MSKFQAAEKYLLVLKTTLEVGWVKYYEKGELTHLEELALLHPEHLYSVDLPEYANKDTIQNDIQGARRFGANIQGEGCMASLLWGYKCTLGGNLQQDHLFPYSLGGPTIGTNRIWLCHYHNMVKTCDIHCFPWRELDKYCVPWLADQLEKMRKFIYSRT